MKNLPLLEEQIAISRVRNYFLSRGVEGYGIKQYTASQFTLAYVMINKIDEAKQN